MDIDIEYLPQFEDLWLKDFRECYIHGGRGTGKSYAVAEYIIIYLLSKKDKRVLICRETSKSIEDSAYENIISKIRNYELEQYFDILKNSIECLHTGTKIIFSGMLPQHIGAIKSKENISLCWIEEAQYISKDSLNVLLPTVLRNDDIKIIYTINPRYPTDAVYSRFNSEIKPEKSISIKTTCLDNPYFSDAMKDERDMSFKIDYEMALHIWEGELIPTGNEMAVLPLNMLKKCVDAHKKIKIRGAFENWAYCGVDIATGSSIDKSSIAISNESLLIDVHEFRCTNNDLVKKVDMYAKQYDCARVYYDGVGVGHNFNTLLDQYSFDRAYSIHPLIGSSSPRGKDVKFTEKYTNGDFFRNLKSQMWWHLRVRLENTIRFIEGEKIDYKKCFFISSKIKNLDKLLLELSQASYSHEDYKLQVDKQPNNISSPNMADSVIYSMYHHMRNGIKNK